MSQNPTPAQLQALLQYASRRLGTTPEALVSAVNENGLQILADKLSPAEAAKLKSIAFDRAKAEEWLRSPTGQQMLRQALNGRA
ncbi:MAG: hypothetical protein ACOYJY_04930 [Acutalibacteraceae bacterium]